MEQRGTGREKERRCQKVHKKVARKTKLEKWPPSFLSPDARSPPPFEAVSPPPLLFDGDDIPPPSDKEGEEEYWKGNKLLPWTRGTCRGRRKGGGGGGGGHVLKMGLEGKEGRTVGHPFVLIRPYSEDPSFLQSAVMQMCFINFEWKGKNKEKKKRTLDSTAKKDTIG